MTDYTIYKNTGKILRTGNCPPDMVEFQTRNEDDLIYLGTCDLWSDYILDGEKVARPTQPTVLDKLTLSADGVDAITITDSLLGTFTATNIITQETITGSIEGIDTFSTTIVGSYQIKIESFPYLDFTATIEAT